MFQVELFWHLVDGVHEIVTVRNLESGYEVMKSDSVYDSKIGDLNYETSVIGLRLRCLFVQSEELETLTCSRNDMPVDGIKLEVKFTCPLERNIPGCDVLKTETYADRIQKNLVKKETLVLEKA